MTGCRAVLPASDLAVYAVGHCPARTRRRGTHPARPRCGIVDASTRTPRTGGNSPLNAKNPQKGGLATTEHPHGSRSMAGKLSPRTRALSLRTGMSLPQGPPAGAARRDGVSTTGELNRHGVLVSPPWTSHSKHTARLIALWLVMDARARDGNHYTAPATIGTMAARLGASPSAVRDGIRQLKTLGELEVTDAGKFGQVFTVIVPEVGPVQRSAPYRPAIPTGVRAYVYARDGWLCKHCGTPDNLSIDHIWPVIKGGGGEASNLQTLCVDCNRRKGART